MQRVRRGKHHAIGTVLFEEFAERSEERNVGLFGDFGSGGTRVDDGCQLAALALLNQFDVASADEARAGNGKLDLSHD
jgi:hypothetical protein